MKTLNAIRMSALLGGARAPRDGKSPRGLLALIICSGPGPFYPIGARYALCYVLCAS